MPHFADPPGSALYFRIFKWKAVSEFFQRQHSKCLFVGSTDRAKELDLMCTERNVRGDREATKVEGRLILKSV
jgi:hypothetical protein